jgi:cell division protein FtsQ
MRPLSERKTRTRAAARQAARPLRELPKVQPGTARRRRKAKPSLLGRLLPPRFVAIAGSGAVLALLLGLAVTGTLGRAYHSFKAVTGTVSGDAGFSIRAIHITGERRTPAATIAAALDLHQNQSIFSANLAAARARLLALDWIAAADVVRRYPDSIYVTLVEKRPFALWQAPPDATGTVRVAIVERNGGIITTSGVENFARLPKLFGDGAPKAAADLIDAVQSHRAVAARIGAYEFVSQRRWNLLLNDGVIVQLPEQGWQAQIDALERLIIDKGILERDISEIDLRSPTHYFFLLRNGDKKDVERGKET